VYLAFTPQFRTTPHIDINVWVERTAANKGFKFKYGRTREDCEACNPVSVELSEVESHVVDIKNNKIWVKVPLKNITNIASYTEDLVQNIGFVRLFVAGKADEWKYKYAEPQDVMLSSEGATSINRFGILRNDSVTTNTMIAIPWTWYSETEETATDIPTRKLVKETFLSEGDTLLQFTQSGTYAAWYMFDNEWQTISTVKVKGFNDIEISDPKQESGKMDIIEQNDLTIKRGRALWLCRQNPTKPFYVYGQDTQTDVVTDITLSPEEPTNQNASKTGVTSNAIGNPFLEEVNINDLVFDGEINEEWDRLWIPNGTVTAIYVIRLRGMWVYATLDPGTRRTKYVTDIRVKPGLGFWYDRRSTKPMKIKWRK